MSSSPTNEDLAEIRRAALELRENDLTEAVRVLRRVVRRGGETEALAQGALGEILLEDLADVDGALHSFRRLLEIAPGLPAGQIGLARALARNADISAQDAYVKAIEGLEQIVRRAMQPTGDEEGEAIEETVLSSLELVIEERDAVRELHAPEARARVSEDILEWAESARLFDGDDPADLEDWLRFALLRSMIPAIDGKREEALQHIDRLAKAVPLPQKDMHRLRSLVYEATEEPSIAADEAIESIRADERASPEALLRAATLLQAAGRPAQAGAIAEQARDYLKSPAAAEEWPEEALKEMLEHAENLIPEVASGLVLLGTPRGRA